MTTFPRAPRLLKSGLIVLDPRTAAVQRVIALQYNPDTLSRSLKTQAVDGEDGDRGHPLRFAGPPVETYKLEAEIDATDQLERGKPGDAALEHGIVPQLAALETLVYPTSAQVRANDRLIDSGALAIIPMEAPLTLFVWNPTRVLPVRITDFDITESPRRRSTQSSTRCGRESVSVCVC